MVDDDPTGAQGQAGVPLLLSWPPDLLAAALRDRPAAVHLMTNSRALDADGAHSIVRDAVEAARTISSDARLVLRGDSTLRAHLLPEYTGMRDALGLSGTYPPLLLVPALPSAGRITHGGRHWLLRDGRRIALEETEFASDGEFSYRSSRLLDWAQERSAGFFLAANGIEIGSSEIRSAGGVERVEQVLLEAAAQSEPGVVVPDAETRADLITIAAGLRRAWAEAPEIIVRCAPAFASVLSGAGATSTAPLPAVLRGLLVVVGSHVSMSSTQLAALGDAYPGALVELDAATLAGPDAGEAVAAAVDAARSRLGRDRLAVVATTRAAAPEALGPEAGMRVARSLAAVVDGTGEASDVLLSKGGITSAVNVRDGLHAEWAHVVGPVAPGISLWRAHENGAHLRPVIVFPGNVGNPESLAELVARLLEE